LTAAKEQQTADISSSSFHALFPFYIAAAYAHLAHLAAIAIADALKIPHSSLLLLLFFFVGRGGGCRRQAADKLPAMTRVVAALS
jgi:hypothetical protein